MKKIILSFFVVSALVYSCSPLERTNPTDPESPSYIGYHFIREIGSFSSLSDFCIMGGNLYAVDISDKRIYKYNFDGINEYYLEDPSPPLSIPSGIAPAGSGPYIIDSDSSEPELTWLDKDNPGSYTEINIQEGGNKITFDGQYLYIAKSEPPAVYKYYGATIAAAPEPVEPFAYWPLTKSTETGGVMYISDIEYSPDYDRILIADSDADRISVFTADGGFEKHIVPGGEVRGIAAQGGIIYVSDETGIHFINFSDGKIYKTIGDYGEGSGRITEPGPVEVSGDNIFYSAGNTIKYFAP